MDTYTYQEIEVERLLLDPENPRHDIFNAQEDSMRIMLAQEGQKVLRLAQHIAFHGLNPAETFIAVPAPEYPGSYYVMDGNRRLTAIKLLLDPSQPALRTKPSFAARIAELSKVFDPQPVERIRCVVFKDRSEAWPWVELQHAGQQNGVGQLPWDPQVKDRFKKVRGRPTVARQVIELVTQHGGLDDTMKQLVEAKAPVSHVVRVLSNPHVREKLGVELKQKQLFTQLPDREVAKGLTRLVVDLTTGKKSLSDINKKEDRIAYVDSFPKSSLPDLTVPRGPVRLLGAPGGDVQSAAASAPPSVPSGDEPATSAAAPTTASTPRNLRPSTDRTALVPTGFKITIKPTRIRQIYNELRVLDVSAFENCAAVAFRVFLELSVEEYMTVQQLKVPGHDKDTLARRMKLVAEHLTTKLILSEKQTKPIILEVYDANSLISAHTFNAYVHNPHLPPKARELKTTWDRLEDFIEAIWQ
jgi:hypothetical protein